MPFRSESQRRKFYAMQARGEIPKGTAEKWQKETGKKKLPEKIKKTASYKKGAQDALNSLGVSDKILTAEDLEKKLKELSEKEVERKGDNAFKKRPKSFYGLIDSYGLPGW